MSYIIKTRIGERWFAGFDDRDDPLVTGDIDRAKIFEAEDVAGAQAKLLNLCGSYFQLKPIPVKKLIAIRSGFFPESKRFVTYRIGGIGSPITSTDDPVTAMADNDDNWEFLKNGLPCGYPISAFKSEVVPL